MFPNTYTYAFEAEIWLEYADKISWNCFESINDLLIRIKVNGI